MKKLFALMLLAFIPFLATADDAVYAQLSSGIAQYGSTIVVFDQIDGIQGMTYAADTGLTFDEGGAYFIVAAPQVVTGKGCYDLWLEVNGAQVSNSNVQYCSQVPKQTDVIVSQGAGCYAAGDILTPVQSGTGIEAIQPDGEPLIPSIIFTAYRIGDC